ncbi:MAG: class D sortase [Actinomycetota bacterium]|nr:class D sortase [Actinomycetota bacterium]
MRDSGQPVGTETRRGRRRAARRLRRRRRTPWLLIAAGIVLVAAVGAWQLYATVWTTHSQSAGRALVHHFLKDNAIGAPLRSPTWSQKPSSGSGGVSTASLATCSASGSGSASGAGTAASASGSSAAGTAVHGLLEIPALGVVAPVEQGTGDGVLAVAVGHDPYSVWPGKTGNAVLLAHDVSYFSTIDQLKSGDTIRYVTPCTTYDFQVSSHAIVTSGSPVYDTTTPSVTLVTCWPTDALWFTPDRYLVTAAEVTKAPTGSSQDTKKTYLTVSSPPSVPVPSALASQGVTLATYSLPMGTFTLVGSPTRSWAQTTSPLLVDGSAVQAFIAGVRALTENHLDWWHAIAPGVKAPAPLVGANNPGYETATDVTEHANGAAATGVTLTDTVSVTGGGHPGRYVMTVRTTVHGRTMTISSWTMSPS